MGNEYLLALRHLKVCTPLVILYGLLGISMLGNSYGQALFVCGLCIKPMILIIVCGQIADRLNGVEPLGAKQQLLMHWRNWLAVTLLLIAPVVFATLLQFLVFGQQSQIRLVNIGIWLVIDLVCLYTYPLVFSKGLGAVAIPASASFLRQNFSRSLPLLILVCISAAIWVTTPYLAIYFVSWLGKGLTESMILPVAVSTLLSAFLVFYIYTLGVIRLGVSQNDT